MATLAGYVVHHKIRWPDGTIVLYHEFVVIRASADFSQNLYPHQCHDCAEGRQELPCWNLSSISLSAWVYLNPNPGCVNENSPVSERAMLFVSAANDTLGSKALWTSHGYPAPAMLAEEL